MVPQPYLLIPRITNSMRPPLPEARTFRTMAEPLEIISVMHHTPLAHTPHQMHTSNILLERIHQFKRDMSYLHIQSQLRTQHPCTAKGVHCMNKDTRARGPRKGEDRMHIRCTYRVSPAGLADCLSSRISLSKLRLAQRQIQLYHCHLYLRPRPCTIWWTRRSTSRWALACIAIKTLGRVCQDPVRMHRHHGEKHL